MFPGSIKRGAAASGVTLIELVLVITVMSVAAPALWSFSTLVTRPYFQVSALARATQLAHSLLEEVLSQRFDELLEPSGGNWSAVGPDPGESDRSRYDDVDDFDGFSEAMTGGLAGFTRSVEVVYVGFAAGVCPCPPVVPAAPNGPTSESYKQITVTVTGPESVSMQLVGLATTANSQGVPAQ